jgi:RND superfamily putative drug exporter
MVQILAHIMNRRWAAIILAWVLLALGLRWAAPGWQSVAQDGQFSFLPADSPSRRADDLFQQSFPCDVLASSVVIVASRAAGQKLTDEDISFVTETLKPRLREALESAGAPVAAAGPVGSAARPVGRNGEHALAGNIHAADEKGVGTRLTSADGQATLIVLELTTDAFSHGNRPLIADIESSLDDMRREKQLPEGLFLDLTGSAVAGRDISRANEQSAADTEFWTILLVVLLTLAVYRAPLLALIPLLTLYAAMTVALHLLALLAGTGLINVFKGCEAYITVVVYASGVDYGLFLISRFREELQSGRSIELAVPDAVAKVGVAIAASSATEIVGIGMLGFAQFGKFHQAGIAISFSLLVMLVAVLTLTPALLRLTGRWAFWPYLAGPADSRATPHAAQADRFLVLWERIAEAIVRRPATLWLTTMILMVPFAVVGALEYNRLNYDLVSNLPRGAASERGMAVLKQHFPAGTAGPVNLLIQNANVDFKNPGGFAAIETLTNRLHENRARLQLADVQSLAAPQGTVRIEDTSNSQSLSEKLLTQGVLRRRAAEHFIGTEDGGEHVTRLIVELGLDPFSEQALDFFGTLETEIKGLLPDELSTNTELLIGGSTASLYDLKSVGQADRMRINVLVVGSICIVLVVLLRKTLLTVYLVLTVLLSYLVTLGTTFALFYLLSPRGFSGLDWTVPLFLFTVLIAVGEDYNILLVTRVAEEVRQFGREQGIQWALARTGPIISSCGIIMAGTFLSLTIAGQLAQMTQLGVALAFGVMLDTFVVRPILVPAGMLMFPRLDTGLVSTPVTPRSRESAMQASVSTQDIAGHP